jgi:ribose transport system substrate-binding protein
MDTAAMLLEAGEKPGSTHRLLFTEPVWLDKTNAHGVNCFPLPNKS